MPETILLAEDDTLTRMMLCEMLDELNYSYRAARNGEECARLLEKDPGGYAVVLMDIHMPTQNGVEATRIIRKAKTDLPSDIPIIAVTADTSWQDLERCRAAGFTEVMEKPVDIQALGRKMREYLKT